MDIKYFQGETIIIKGKPSRTEIKMSEKEITKKYLDGNVRIVTEQARYPLNSILTMLNSGDYELHPEFQRRRRWNRTKQSRLIESFIMNVPIPPIFLYEQEFATYEVMDGLQRLTAISDFYNDKFELVGLEFWPELEGYKYSTLPKAVKQGIDRRYLSSIILLHETASTDEEAQKMKQLVFDRINSGGAKLEYQESRNALYHGKFNEMAERLARNDDFCRIFDIPLQTDEEIRDKKFIPEELADNPMFQKMDDVEMVIRFFAMRYVNNLEGLTLKEFLDRFTEQANQLSEAVLKQYENSFEETIHLVYSLYGDQAFCLLKKNPRNDEWNLAKTPAKILYDPIMYVLSQLIDKGNDLIKKKDEIARDTYDMMMKEYTSFNGRKGSRSDIIKRIELFENIYKRYI